MAKFIIATSSIENLMILKSIWELNPDPFLTPEHEFDANTWDEANNIYDEFIKNKLKSI